MLRLILLLLIGTMVGAVILPARSALAHAEYESSTPARDQVVQQAPAQVEVIFTQEVSRQGDQSSVRVFNEADAQVSEGPGVVDDVDRTRITATLPGDLAPGRYIVQWTTLSDEDGDDDEGSFCFYFAVEPTAAQEAECTAFDADASATATVTDVGPTATLPGAEATPTQSEKGGGSDDGNSGAATGAIVGVVIAVAVVGGALFFWVRRSRA